MNNWINNKLFRLEWPGQCLLCDNPGSGGRDICADCLADLPRSQCRCQVCALPLAQSTDSLCGHCLQEKPYFDQSVAAFDYAHPVDYLVQTLKYQQNLQYGRLLGQLLCERLISVNFPAGKPQLLLPVPLHNKRLRQRGFNQALELSRAVSKTLKIPINTNTCVRIRDTGSLSSLPAKKRKTNIYQSFKIIRSPQVRHVAIVDDVMTSGATSNELARTLKQAGVDEVSVWVFARAF